MILIMIKEMLKNTYKKIKDKMLHLIINFSKT